MRRKILLTGGNGQVGWELQRTLAPLGDVYAPTRQQLDLSQHDALRSLIREFRPQWIVNAAAYTAVDRAEEERVCAFSLNHLVPQVLAEEAEQLGSVLVHFSTDYVFDGEQATPYVESDQPLPLNVYGESKWAGEMAISQVCSRYLIFRTSWVYGLRGSNFLLTMLRLAQERKELSIVDDQVGAPTWSRMIAEATALSLLKVSEGRGGWGTYHLTSQESTSWYGFVKEIVALALPDSSVKLEPIPTSQYPLPAVRPSYSCLDNNRLKQEFGIVLPVWNKALMLCVADL